MPFKVEIHHSGSNIFQKEWYFRLQDRLIHIQEKDSPFEFRMLQVKKFGEQNQETYLQSRAGKWKVDPNEPSLKALNILDLKSKKTTITSFPEDKREILGYTTHLCEIQEQTGNLNHQVYISTHADFQGLSKKFSEKLPGFPLAWATRKAGQETQSARAVFAGSDFDPAEIPQPVAEEYEAFSLGKLNKIAGAMGFRNWRDWWKLVGNVAEWKK